MKNKIVIFDVCGTLYDGNSTLDFCTFLCRKWFRPWWIFFFHKSLDFIYLLLRKLTNFDFQRKIIALFFRWFNVANISHFYEDFWNEYKKKLINVSYLSKYLKNESCHVFLVSASIEPPIYIFWDKFKLPHYSSKLEIINGVFTGRFSLDLLGNKDCIINKILKKFPLENIILFTDNKSDIWLINLLINRKFFFHLYIIPYHNKDFWDESLIVFKGNPHFTYEFI